MKYFIYIYIYGITNKIITHELKIFQDISHIELKIPPTLPVTVGLQRYLNDPKL